MSFFNLLLLLTALVVAVLTPVFIGYGLSVGSVSAMILGALCAPVAAGMILAHVRIADREQRRGQPQHGGH